MKKTKLRKKAEFGKKSKRSQEIFVFRCSEKIKKNFDRGTHYENRELYFTKIVLKTILNLVSC